MLLASPAPRAIACKLDALYPRYGVSFLLISISLSRSLLSLSVCLSVFLHLVVHDHD